MPRAIEDALLTVTRALPTSDGTVTSDDIDLGIKPGDLEAYEFEVELPELTSTHLPNADTLTITLQTGDAPAPTSSSGQVVVITGTGSTIAAQKIRFKVPSDKIKRYNNVKFVAAGGTGNMSGITAKFKVLT